MWAFPPSGTFSCSFLIRESDARGHFAHCDKKIRKKKCFIVARSKRLSLFVFSTIDHRIFLKNKLSAIIARWLVYVDARVAKSTKKLKVHPLFIEISRTEGKVLIFFSTLDI